MRTASLKYYLGGTTGNPVPFYPIQLYKDGKPNHGMVAAYAALTGKTVNIADAYTAEGFDFSGTRAFDQKTGYRSKSFLTRADEATTSARSSACCSSSTPTIRRPARSCRSRPPTSAWPSRSPRRPRWRSPTGMLINQLEQLFESFINLINTAIDEKSPYTGGHCQRVPQLTMMLAEAVNDTTEGPLSDFHMTDKDRYELKIAGPAARLRQGHHAGARRRQGDQAGDHLRPRSTSSTRASRCSSATPRSRRSKAR